MDIKTKEIKQRYFDKIYENATEVLCACGCGTTIKNKDKYGRDKKYVSGHNTERKYEDPTQFKREWNHRNRHSRQVRKKERTTRLKEEAVIFKGGKCEDCGFLYDGTNARAFDFHHLDPETKEYSLNKTSLNNMSKEKRDIELSKAILLCATCHRLRHN